MGRLTLYTVVFGDDYHTYVDGWLDAALNVGADEVLIVSDRHRFVPDGVRLVMHQTGYHFREAGMRQHAVQLAQSEWVWLIDVDDRVLPDVAGVVDRDADVVQAGFIRSDGDVYIPNVIPHSTFLEQRMNRYVGTSPVRRDTLLKVGGWPDVGYADWALWRKLARARARFVSADRICFEYNWHPETSLTGKKRNRRELVDEVMRF
jgi:hypothetical protein